MSDARPGSSVLRLLRLLADHIEGYLEGDELAFETLGEAIDQGRYSEDDVQAAILVLRNLVCDVPGNEVAVDHTPGKRAMRVLSAEERDSLSPEACGFLLGLRGRGALDARQFERVLDLLTGSGVRPVDVALAREVAARVVLQFDEPNGESEHGEIDLAH